MWFRGKYDFLSNFYPSDVVMELNGKTYTFPNVECAFQAHKCLDKAEEFLNLSGLQAKRYGKKVPLRSDWEEIKDNVMYECLKSKFTGNPELLEKLKAVDEPISETNNWHDYYWGVCNGKGKNVLGILLERIKSEI